MFIDDVPADTLTDPAALTTFTPTPTTTNYTVNSTIYFQTTITQNVGMSEEMFAPDSTDQQGELL